jgi:hypothetical protein
MLIPNHPHDERLAALASADADAVDDAELTSHVASCPQCTETVTELGALRASLADLPDLRPSRPLQLVPGVESGAGVTDSPADRLTDWVRRTFAPVMAVGATLALVGLVGTTMGPTTSSIVQNVGAELDAGLGDAGEPPEAGGEGAEAPAGEEAQGDGAAASAEVRPLATSGSVYDYGTEGDNEDGSTSQLDSSDDGQRDEASGVDDSDALTGPPAERSPWPMVFFGGIALVIAGLLLRWIAVPRAG